MLYESKDILVLVATIAAALLGAVITLLALAPILGDIIARYHSGFFESRQLTTWVRRLVFALSLISGELALALLLTCAAVFFPCQQELLSRLALGLSFVGITTFLIVLIIALFITRRLTR